VEREIMRLRWEVYPPKTYAEIIRVIPELRDQLENTIAMWVCRILRDTRRDLRKLW
jgi:hypothetical protein